MEDPYDFSNTDAFAMSKATGLRITEIYEVLGLPNDPQTQAVLDKIWELPEGGKMSMKEWCDAKNAEARYLESLGAKEMGVFSPVEDYETIERIKSKMGDEHAAWRGESAKKGSHADPFRKIASVWMSQERVQSGIPWGTQANIDRITLEAESVVSFDDLLKLFNEIPYHSLTSEADIVLKIMARRFFQKPTA